MAVNCAILSYNGTVYFGFSGDVHAAPDLRQTGEIAAGEFHGTAGRGGNQTAARKESAPEDEGRIVGHRAKDSARGGASTSRVPIVVSVSPLNRNEYQNLRRAMNRRKLSQFRCRVGDASIGE